MNEVCPRCGGWLIRDWDDAICLCGYRVSLNRIGKQKVKQPFPSGLAFLLNNILGAKLHDIQPEENLIRECARSHNWCANCPVINECKMAFDNIESSEHFALYFAAIQSRLKEFETQESLVK